MPHMAFTEQPEVLDPCRWCGKRRKASDWEQERLSRGWSRLCVTCARRRLRNPLNALLPMRKIAATEATEARQENTMTRAATALAIITALLLPAACGRAYLYPWCSPVIHAITTKTTAHREIAQLQAQAGKSPLARQLASDMQDAQTALSTQASSSNLDAIGTTAAAIHAINRIGADADRIAAACGATIRHRDIYVPTG